jgi:hypothetical protein
MRLQTSWQHLDLDALFYDKLSDLALGTCIKSATAEEIGSLFVKQYRNLLSRWHQV